MNQSLLNRAVARATGESVSTIRHLGFSIVDQKSCQDAERLAKPRIVNWDRLDAQRPAFLPQRARTRSLA